jgi:CheY-like chemotaxis protein
MATRHDPTDTHSAYDLFRGIYSRVARQLGVDRSYVSRVAQGERRSPRIEQALREELHRIEKALKSRGRGMPAKGPHPAVLVVDDERIIADSIAQILRNNGYQARVAYGGPDAIRKVMDECPDIMLSDVVMPQINGIEAAKAIHEMCPDVRILLFSGQATTVNLMETAAQQGYHFEILQKPIHPDALLAKLRAHEASSQ